MITESLDIKNISKEDFNFITKKQRSYSSAFHFLYKKSDEEKTKDLIDYIKQRFHLNDIEYRSILSESNQLKTTFQSDLKEKEDDINYVEIELDELKNEKIKEEKKKVPSKKKIKQFTRKIFKLNKKVDKLKSALNNNVVFGGRDNLKKISFLSNPTAKEKEIEKIGNKGINKKKDKKKENIKEKQEFSIEHWRKEYQSKRLKSIYILGEANQGGNRFFDFDLENNIIIYKPYKGKKIKLELTNYHNKKEEFKRLQELIDNNSISITIQLDTEEIHLTFEDELLSIYAINEVERRKDVEKVKKECLDKGLSKEEQTKKIKSVYRKYYEAQRKLRLEGKIENRSINLDLNPEFIGYSITQRVEDKMYLLKCGSFSLQKLTKKLKKDSTDEQQKYQNDKRKHELLEIISKLFKIANHYKVSIFIIEKLNLDNSEVLNRESNRKIKNIWNRELIYNSLNKRCKLSGIELREVNPAYSSFIGNLKYNYIDPVAASIEIGRRGLFKFEKNKFYPSLEDTIIHTMGALCKKSGDVDMVKGDQTSWVKLYIFAQKNNLRWRRRLRGTEHYAMVSMSTKKSKVKQIEYFPNGIVVV